MGHPHPQLDDTIAVNPLRPRFPPAVISEVTGLSGSMCRDHLQKNCKANRIAYGLVQAAVGVATQFFDGKELRGADETRAIPPTTYPIENAAIVASMALDTSSTTHAESVLAALFEQIIAANPAKAEPMQTALLAAMRDPDGSLPSGYAAAIKDGFALAEQVARVSRIPRLCFQNQALPKSVWLDMQEIALSMPDARVVPIKLCEAMNRLRLLAKDEKNIKFLTVWEDQSIAFSNPPDKAYKRLHKTEKETLAILALAENFYVPLAEAIGWNGGKAKLEDLIFSCRQPAARAQITAEVEAVMGEGFFAQGRELVDVGKRFIFNVVHKALNEGKPPEEHVRFTVQGRAKQPVSFWKKMQKKAAHYKSVADMPDPLGFRIVLEGERLEACYDVVNKALQRAFDMDHNQTKDHIVSDERPDYQSYHLVVTVKDRPHRLGIDIPEALRGKTMEVQVRTEAMNEVAETGNAAHWVYKMGETVPQSLLTLAAQVRRNVANSLAGMPMLPVMASDMFVVDGAGKPCRIVGIAADAPPSIMDGLVAIDPKMIFASAVTVNGTKVEMSHTQQAPYLPLRNGDVLAPVGVDYQNRRQIEEIWCVAATTALGRTVLEQARERGKLKAVGWQQRLTNQIAGQIAGSFGHKSP
jgi:ppGpp synthetase/RelA/SpoT-type nucleotidyltranferase